MSGGGLGPIRAGGGMDSASVSSLMVVLLHSALFPGPFLPGPMSISPLAQKELTDKDLCGDFYGNTSLKVLRLEGG